MTGLVRAELLKYFTTRMSWSMPLTMFLVGAIFAAVQGLVLVLIGEFPGSGGEVIRPAELFDDLTLARMVYTGAIQMGYLLALVLGILAMGGEFRHRTITSTLLSAPRRGRLLTAKVTGLVLVVLVNGVAFVAGSLLGGGIMLAVGDAAVFPEPGQLLGTPAKMLLILVLWGLIGFGLGVLIPNQVIALFVGIGVTLLIEPLLGFGLTFVDQLKEAARYFPSQATTSVLDLFAGVDDATAQSMGSADPLTWWVGALVLLGYAAVMTLLGWVVTTRRDVS
ncbi:ABC transporter permease subunit [Ornithinimicrobium tianjinense]|uniref:ABC transporter permease n=1 Tax=Ornithinimicrobium tianjinense TaxID=1195761 RepID=A0A917BFT1_9MICO|nr:ABC transporter permease subunit [Ornithinimicrobium tianjinense]GGF41196.1 ABC transporter permease [Ornithinimicrobium tianjinense]